jgi:voltage-gated potassium channel Kch
MLYPLLLGCVLTIVTTMVHAGAMVLALRVLRLVHIGRRNLRSLHAKAALVAALVLMMFLASLVEAGIWAIAYVKAGAFASVEPALYFSTVTFTTLGYGDLVIGDDWRLVASFEAANGTIMFGWTAALIVAFVQRVYFGAKVTGEE